MNISKSYIAYLYFFIKRVFPLAQFKLERAVGLFTMVLCIMMLNLVVFLCSHILKDMAIYHQYALELRIGAVVTVVLSLILDTKIEHWFESKKGQQYLGDFETRYHHGLGYVIFLVSILSFWSPLLVIGLSSIK
jgi:hypothetical protein